MTPTHVVAVWCGRLSGTEHPALVGSRAALPTALELARALDRGEPWERPQEVRVRQVCALSGAVPSPACESLVEGEYIPGVSSEVPCALHRFSDEDGRRRSVVLWPPDVAAYMASLERADDGETSSAGGGRVLMVSPRAGGEYVLVPKEAGPARELDRLPLVARTPAGTKVIYWFLDGELLSSCPPDGRVEWTMECGSHVMVASCDTGTTAVARFRVLRPPGSAGRARR